MLKCAYCDGSGILDCDICYRMRKNTGLNNCLYCNWDGKKTCLVCDGAGVVEYYHGNEELYRIDPYYQDGESI